LKGFPWWPSLVCDHPTLNHHLKGKGQRKEVHVQFFDNPPTRSWILLKNLQPFSGSNTPDSQLGGRFHTLNETCVAGAKEADQALQLSLEERLALVVELLPSSESEAEDDAMGELDPAIFDQEMSEDEANNSKENHNEAEMKSPSKKTPQKNGRSRRRATKRRKVLAQCDDALDDSGDDENFKMGSDDSGSDDEGSSGVSESEPDTDTDNDPTTPVKGEKTKKRPIFRGAKRSHPGSNKAKKKTNKNNKWTNYQRSQET